MSEIRFEEQEFSTRFNGKTFRRLLTLALPHWPWALGFLACIALVSTQDAIFTFISKLMIDEGIVAGDKARLMQLLTLYGGLAIIQAAAVFGFIFLAGVLGERINYDLRKKMFNHLQELSFAYFDRTPVGWIMSRLTSDATKMADLITWGLLDITWAILNVTTSMVFMFTINWRLALAVLAVLPLMLAAAVKFQKRIIGQFRRVRKQN